MKKSFAISVFFSAAAFLVASSVSVVLLTGLDQVWGQNSAPSDSGFLSVALVLPAEHDTFWESYTAEVVRLGALQGTSYEVVRYSATGIGAREQFEKMSLSEVEAILFYPPETLDGATALVQAAEARGIPVLTLENDLPSTPRRVYLGASSYQMGHDTGKVIRSSALGPIRGGLLLSQTDQVRQTVRNSLFVNGLNDALAGEAKPVEWQELFSPPGRFAGEELVWSLLRSRPTLNLLVTANAKDTLSALQAIVDANRVGKIHLVGVGEDPGLREALNQGILEGLLVRDPGRWADITVNTVAAVLKGVSVSSYVTLPVNTLTSQGGGFSGP